VALVRTEVVPPSPRLNYSITNGWLGLEWTAPGFDLQHAPFVTGPWFDVVPPATSPYLVTSTNGQEYFRLEWSAP
jgi:hypothetical protein